MSLRPIQEFIKDTTWQCAIVAHRGAWGPEPENSIGALQTAIKQQYHFVEIDVRESFDDILYCFHDATIDRMTNGQGTLLRTWKKISDERLRSGDGGDGATLTEQGIPRFDEMMAIAKDNIYLDVDVKLLHQLERVAKCINESGMSSFVNLKMDIYSENDLIQMQQLERSSGILVKPVIRFDSKNVESLQLMLKRHQFPIVEAIFDNWDTLSKISSTCKAINTDIFVNCLDTVPSCLVNDSMARTDPDGVWGRLIECGIRHIQTDTPRVMQDYLLSKSCLSSAIVD